jgi:hypothetical protein
LGSSRHSHRIIVPSSTKEKEASSTRRRARPSNGTERNSGLRNASANPLLKGVGEGHAERICRSHVHQSREDVRSLSAERIYRTWFRCRHRAVGSRKERDQSAGNPPPRGRTTRRTEARCDWMARAHDPARQGRRGKWTNYRLARGRTVPQTRDFAIRETIETDKWALKRGACTSMSELIPTRRFRDRWLDIS